MRHQRLICLAIVLLIPVQAFSAQKIAVIGAGLSGLTAAYRLHKAGYEVQVYEARNRLGGRVFTVNLNGTIAELGGENINDGGEGINIVNIAKELGLTIDNEESRVARFYYDEQTHKVSDFYKDLMPHFPLLTGKIIDDLKKISMSSKNMAEVLDKFFGLYPQMRKIYGAWVRGYEGSDLERLSPAYAHMSLLWMLENSEKNYQHLKKGEPIFYNKRSIHGGNAKLAEALARPLGKNLHLNSPLAAIAAHEGGGYSLTFKDNTRVNADIIVLTIPCSVFADIDFGPSTIPSPTLEQMRALSYGTNAKILAPIRDKTSAWGTVTTQNLSTWFDKNNKVLTFYYGGAAGVMATPEDFKKSYARDRAAVAATFKGINLPTATAVAVPREEQFSSYIKPVGIAWALEPYSKASYSNYSPEQYSERKQSTKVEGELVIRLFKPLNDTIFFAGEHTALEHPATLEGAVESGERTSRILINLLRRTLTKTTPLAVQ